MNIAELFVRVRADTSDLTTKLRGASASVDEFGNTVKRSTAAHEGHTLSLGRVERALASYVGHAAGANAVTEQLSTAFGAFALGGELVAGVLLGIGAIVAVYEHLTSGARKAREEADKLTKSLNDQADARFNATEAGKRAQVASAGSNLGNVKGETGAGFFSQLLQGLAPGGQSMGALTGSDAAAKVTRIAAAARAAQEALNQLGVEIGQANDATAQRVAENARKAKEASDAIVAAAKKAQAEFFAATSSAMAVFDEFATHNIKSHVLNETLIDDYQRIAETIRRMGNDSTPAYMELLKLRDALMANLVVAQAVAAANSTGIVGPLVGKALPGVGLTPNGAIGDASSRLVTAPLPNVGGVHEIVHVETAIERQTREAAQHAQALKDAIASSAQVIGSAVLAAVNIGGGGRGSQLGGALGGGLGSALGTFATAGAVASGTLAGAAIGSVVPIVGTIVGGLIGSAIGGIFDHHKKAVDNNTAALNRLTSALFNAPSGFKVAYYDDQAADPKMIARLARTQRQVASRGGSTGFALAGG